MPEPNNFKAYDIDTCIAEIYDQTEIQTEDIYLLRKLIADLGQLRILEPFCGNGRILIPLAQDGHEIVGMDKSKPMLESATRKLQQLPETVRSKVRLNEADVLDSPWPRGFDLVILGANCFYELPTAESQEWCIHQASESLRVGGHLYLDNGHMEGDLEPTWYEPGIKENRFPTGTCSDGTSVKGTTETIWYNIKERLVHLQRAVEIMTPDGKIKKKEWIEQKHSPSTAEMKMWLEKYGFVIESLWGDRKQSTYTDHSARAIFFARFSGK